MKRERMTAPAVGVSALMVIFAVLCMTVFALLSLSTAQAEKRLSDAAVQSVTDYYAADLEAEKVFARLRLGEVVEGVRMDGCCYRYECSISENQTLEVELKKTAHTWRILRWQVVAGSAPVSETLPVWDGM